MAGWIPAWGRKEEKEGGGFPTRSMRGSMTSASLSSMLSISSTHTIEADGNANKTPCAPMGNAGPETKYYGGPTPVRMNKNSRKDADHTSDNLIRTADHARWKYIEQRFHPR
eukprot:CAMPEP_0171445110 /NCGR_PEP_ID=MMETSP0881-20121228/35079_1 /TAXON_ID=67004 /ORGANISM="Thalassiosira weissflogii, Strain CCMP1336" /LENGTH=111 /DNA_ID=CAMNT_0011969009 /DNA_START=388 /DNA_END=719 /DNA_ORIENTATION=+